MRGEGATLEEVEVVVVPLVDWASLTVLDTSQTTRFTVNSSGPYLNMSQPSPDHHPTTTRPPPGHHPTITPPQDCLSST